jgi:TRAP-type C4-dicarboxylate transport system permease small subunit
VVGALEVCMNYLDRINIFLNRILMVLGGIAVLGLMVLATGNVVLRVFHIPYKGAYEVVAFLGAVVIAFALGYTQRRKDHIVVDILTEKFPKKVNRVLDGLNYLITMIFFSLVTWQTFRFAMKIWSSREVSETLKIIYHPFILCVAVGFAVFTFTIMLDFVKTLAGTEER